MTRCRKCGERKRRWPRSCSRCRSSSDGADAAVDAGELAADLGMFGWIWRGVVGAGRLVLRAFD